MSFLWPEALWWLLLLPASVAGYVLILRRNKGEALHYTRLGMMRAAMGRGQAIRRHIPAALLLVALACMLLALGRPAAVVTLPTQSETVILAIDVSQSMRAEDVKPTRLAAAQAAAKAFIRQRPRSARIGIVAFAGSAALVQAPTTKREDLHAAIDQLQLDAATAVGSGIVASLKAIFPDQKAKPEPVPPGSYKSAAIILLTDGETNVGHEPLAAARLAAERGVRVFTVGVGTPEGEVNTDGWSMRVSVDEDALKGIADLTRGEYYFAARAPDLRKIYEGLNSRLVLEKSETEITAFFAGLAAALTLLAAALSLLWFKRVL